MKEEKEQKKSRKQLHEFRLNQALRDNLRKRKQQMQKRKEIQHTIELSIETDLNIDQN